MPGELFGIGGAGSVRGFEERELAGDSGASLSLEAVSANLAESVAWLDGGDLRALLFADAGTVSNSYDAACQAGRRAAPPRRGHRALPWRVPPHAAPPPACEARQS